MSRLCPMKPNHVHLDRRIFVFVAVGIQVAEAIVGFHDSAQFSVAGVVKLGVGGEEDEFTRPFPPIDFVVTNDGLG